MLIVVNDITEQRRAARQEAERAELLAMFHGFTDRSQRVPRRSSKRRRDLLEALRDRHADLVTPQAGAPHLKGNAGLAGFGAIAELCHRAEEQLADGDDAEAADTWRPLVERWQTLPTTLADAARRARARRGGGPGRASSTRCSRNCAGRARPPRHRSAVDWTLEPAERPLARLAGYARSLAQRLGKGEIQVAIEGRRRARGPAALGAGCGRSWSTSSATPSTTAWKRPRSGAPRRSRRSRGCGWRRRRSGERLVIEIEDDGRGIDWDAVRSIAQAKGMPCDSPEDLTAVLLAPDVTTATNITSTSGRGMGLASVAARVRELGGDIAVRSRKGQGTQFRVSLPLTAIAPPRAEPVRAARHIA